MTKFDLELTMASELFVVVFRLISLLQSDATLCLTCNTNNKISALKGHRLHFGKALRNLLHFMESKLFFKISLYITFYHLFSNL